MADVFNMSGDFRGAIINIKSILKETTQIVNSLPKADQASKDELKQLIAQLNDELQKVPPDKAEEAEAVADSAKALIEATNKNRPNKVTVQVTAEGLKKAAENIAKVTPTVLAIATQIAVIASRLAV